MGVINSAIVTAPISEENRKRLNDLIGEDRITYFKPFSFPEMQKMAAQGASKEDIMKAQRDFKESVKAAFVEKDPEVAILGSDIFDGVLAGKNLKLVHCTHAGVEKSARKEVFDRGIVLACSAGRNAPALAEHAMMFILNLVYDINLIRDTQKAHKYGLGPRYGMRSALYGKTVGIIGVGHNGCELAARLKGFGVRTLGYDRFVREVDGIENVYDTTPENLKYILQESDFLVLTVALNNATYHMINKETLSYMKPSACLVNIARGGLVDQNDLIEALENHVIAGAGLDCLETEPLAEDSPLWDMPNVIITPHTTPVIANKGDKEWDYALQNVKAFIEDGEYVNRFRAEDVFTLKK